MKRICVFCGSSRGNKAVYAKAAEEMGAQLVHRGLGLVYGGGNIGLMGVLADAVLARGGDVIGVIPAILVSKEVAHQKVADMRVVDSMLERKQLMADLSDGFITLPGGLGSLDELFEALTWSQLGIHLKPCGLLNVDGYYDLLLDFIGKCETDGFLKPKHKKMLLVDTDPKTLLDSLLSA